MRDGAASPPPAVPSWARFMAVSARLLDCHDSQRSPAGVITPITEDRRGSSGGVYAGVAWGLLQYLAEEELAGRLDYVDITPYAEQAAAQYAEQGVVPDTVRQIAVILATPTQISFAAPPLPADEPAGGETALLGATRETNLIEKHRKGYRCRLSRHGREALQFASGYLRWVHAGVESQKLTRDLQHHDFRSFMSIGQRLWLQVRDQMIRITQALEKPEADALRQEFLDEADRYVQTLDEIRAVVTECMMLLQQPDLREALVAWCAGAENTDWLEPESFSNVLRDLNNAASNLQIKFSQLIEAVSQRARSHLTGVRFEEIARQFARRPEGVLTRPDVLAGMFQRIGPVMPEAQDFQIMDMHRSVPAVRPRKRPDPPRQRRVPEEPKADSLLDFLRRNREKLLAVLAQGPLRLSDLIEDTHELDFRDLEEEVEALGLFVSPLVLVDDNDRQRIQVRPVGVGRWSFGGGWSVSGHDLELRLLEREEDPK
jgi:hypothetical protein